MGIKAMFSDAADFSNIFDESPIGTRITQVQHKTFIDVNEIGCEAAGVSCTCDLPNSLLSLRLILTISLSSRCCWCAHVSASGSQDLCGRSSICIPHSRSARGLLHRTHCQVLKSFFKTFFKQYYFMSFHYLSNHQHE